MHPLVKQHQKQRISDEVCISHLLVGRLVGRFVGRFEGRDVRGLIEQLILY